MKVHVRIVRGAPDPVWSLSLFGTWLIFVAGWFCRVGYRVVTAW